MGAESSDAAEIKQNGWRQGSCLDEKLVGKLVDGKKLPRNNPSGVWVVLSHDCDVTNSSLSSEPTVELIFAVKMDEADRNGQIEWSKNPRRLQVVDSPQDVATRYEIRVHDRCIVQRSELLGHSPSEHKLDPEVIKQIVAWVAKRYVRSAFADAFNQRISPAASRLRKPLQRDGDLLTGIYFSVVDRELPQGEDYPLAIRATMNLDAFQDQTLHDRAQKLVFTIANTIGECDGIDVIESDLVPESRFTLIDLRHTKRWDLDTLTLRDEGQEAIPPTGA